MKKPNLLVWKKGKFHINAELVFTFYQEHGIPVEIFVGWVNDFLKNKNLSIYHKIRAYVEYENERDKNN